MWMTRSPNVCRIAPSTPIAWSHAVGAAHAEVDARRSRSGRAAARGSRSPRARALRQAQQSSRRRRRRRARHAGGAARRRVWSSAWALRGKMSDRASLLPNFSAVPATDSPTDTDAVGAATAPTAGADTGNGPPPERSDDLLIEVDGQLVPNYAATIKPINEHDVVSGEVVRIDKDEVLVDIGYKSEGVIPATELSIRRSVDPADEVSLGIASTRLSSPRRTPRVASSCRRSAPGSRRRGAGSRPRRGRASRSRAP